MSEHSPIGWTDATWPIVAGCDYVSPGCANCWAVRDSWRMAHNPNPKVHSAYFGTVDKQDSGKLVWSGIVRTLPLRLDWPLKWRKPRRIFVCSQADLFNPKVPFEFIAAAFGVMAACPEHTFQVLTKHADRMRAFFGWLETQQGGALPTCLWEARKALGDRFASREPFLDALPAWPLENVWLGVTVEDQKRANERIPHLIATSAAKRWLSVEPMLEPIDLWAARGCPPASLQSALDWVVCGGESAQTRANTRPFDIAWARDLLEQCHGAGVPFFMKQLGTAPIWNGHTLPDQWWPPSMRKEDRGEGFFRVLPPEGKNARYKFPEPEHWPEDLRVQEFPT